MTDATRGLVRYRQPYLGEMQEHPSGDWVRYEDAERIAAERDVARSAAESLERLLGRERAEHSRAMSDAAVERIRPSCSEEGGSCHAMMHSMCRRMNAMERDAALIQRARVKLFVRCLEMMAEARVAVLEYGGDRFRKRNERWMKMMNRITREERRLHRLARHITAKYLGEKS